jgi:nitrite reductase/ring-hydroxylating ferredoxin subunit
VRHYVALSAVGIDQLQDGERLIEACGVPFSIVRTTQVFELLDRIADAETQGVTVRVPPALIQPIAADDVVRVLAEIAVGAPLNGTIEVGGPEPFYLDGLLQRVLGARNDPRRVIDDVHAHYCGAAVGRRSLLAGDEARLGTIRFDDWLRQTPVETTNYEFRVSDVPAGSVLLLGDVAVSSAAGGFCATQALCPHRGGPLSEGPVDDTTVTCPLHGARFDIWTGAVLGGPATEPLETYRVCISGDVGRVEVKRPLISG